MKNYALVGGCLMTATLGSIHAFSVFLNPLENALLLNRASISSIYSLALVSLTLGVLVGYLVYPLLTVPRLVLGIFSVTALGLLICTVRPRRK